MKKGLLIASIASVTAVAAGLAFAVANANKSIRFEAAKATAKSFRLDSTSEITGISGKTFSIPSAMPKEFTFSTYEGYTEGNGPDVWREPGRNGTPPWTPDGCRGPHEGSRTGWRRSSSCRL